MVFPLVPLIQLLSYATVQAGLFLSSVTPNDLSVFNPAIALMVPALALVAALSDEPRLPWTRPGR